jgi:hypothetical protein
VLQALSLTWDPSSIHAPIVKPQDPDPDEPKK